MRKVWNKIFVYFINGIVLLLPIVITISLVRFLVRQVNNLILNPIVSFIAPRIEGPGSVYLAKGVVFVLVIVAVSLIGWGARIIFINRIFSFGERVLFKVPIMGRIYNAIKQISSAFLGEGKTVFKQVVLIEYPRKGIYSIGFTTGDVKGEIKEMLDGEGVNVFVPTTPNPTSGIFLVVPKESVQLLKMSVEEGMKLVISGGSVSPPFRVQD